MRLIIFSLVLLFSPVLAADWPSDMSPRPQVRLVAERGGAALLFALGSVWKTYTKNPGETGIAPKFDWSGSKNLKRAEVVFPRAIKHAVFGGTVLGYRGDLRLPIKLIALDPSKPIHLRLKLFYAICDDICIPLEERLTLMLAPNHASVL